MSLARQPLITEEELAFGVMGFAMGPLCISEYLRDVTEDWHKIEGEEYFHNGVLHVNVPDWHIPAPRSPIHRSDAARIIVVPLKEPSVSGERVKSALTPFGMTKRDLSTTRPRRRDSGETRAGITPTKKHQSRSSV